MAVWNDQEGTFVVLRIGDFGTSFPKDRAVEFGRNSKVGFMDSAWAYWWRSIHGELGEQDSAARCVG